MHWEIPSIGSVGSTVKPLPAFPAGLLYGYCVYTTFRLPLARQWQEAHLERLEDNARAIGLTWPYSRSALLEIIQQQTQPEKPVLRLTAMADVEGYGNFYTGKPLNCRLILSVRPAPPDANLGIALQSVAYTRSLANIKLGAMPELILLKREAQTQGFNDILLLNASGHISEASTANIFLIENGALSTPHPERDHCLPGITRLRILEAAAQMNIPVSDAAPIAVGSINSLDGAFLTNAAQGVMPITRIDKTTLPWPAAAREMMTALAERMALPD